MVIICCKTHDLGQWLANHLGFTKEQFHTATWDHANHWWMGLRNKTIIFFGPNPTTAEDKANYYEIKNILQTYNTILNVDDNRNF